MAPIDDTAAFLDRLARRTVDFPGVCSDEGNDFLIRFAADCREKARELRGWDMRQQNETAALRARNVELEAMVQAARADVERAAAFLDDIARRFDMMFRDGWDAAGDCHAKARELRGETWTERCAECGQRIWTAKLKGETHE